MGFPRQGYRSGLPFPSPGDLPRPGIEPASPGLQEDSLLLSHQGSSWKRFLKCMKNKRRAWSDHQTCENPHANNGGSRLWNWPPFKNGRVCLGICRGWDWWVSTYAVFRKDPGWGGRDGQLGASDSDEGVKTAARASVPWSPFSNVSPTSQVTH